MSSKKDDFSPMVIQSTPTFQATECGIAADMPYKTSKLSASFPDMLKDTSTLSMLDYFIQYLETVHAMHLIQFYLCVESFRATITSREPLKSKNRSRSLERRSKRHGLSRTSSVSSSGSDNSIRWAPREAPGGGDAEERMGHSHYGSPIIGSNVGKVNDELRSSSRGGGEGIFKGEDSSGKDSGGIAGDDSPNKTSSNKTSPIVDFNKRLYRRETENHMYCNCKVHMVSTPPGTPEYPRVINGRPGSWQGSPSVSVKCEHGSPDTLSRTTVDSNPAEGQNAADKISNQSAEEDAIGIYTKYLALNAAQPVGITDEIRQHVEVSICPEDGNISSTCFDDSQKYVYEIMRKKYFPGFLHSSFLCKYQLEYIASGNLNLSDFLLGETALSYYMEFMEQERMSHLLQFWLIADSFHNEFSSPNHTPNMEADINDAMMIYDRYLSLQAKESLNMEDSVRLDVENRICDEHGPRPDSFLRPQLVAFHTMNELYYPSFKESSIYLRFLSELLHTLNKEDEISSSQSVPDSSTSEANNSESNAATSNTHTHHVASLAAHIAGRDLDDPSSLYSRPCLLFRLGYVNEMGEYISEIDHLDNVKPSKREGGPWNTSRARKKRRREKELAMEIARNIIAEVLDTANSRTPALD